MKALVRKSHRDYTYGISVNAKYNPKKFWSYISSLRKDCDNTCFTINGTTVSDPSDIADKFNNHFCSKFDGIYINLLILVLFLIPQLYMVLLLFLLTHFL